MRLPLLNMIQESRPVNTSLSWFPWQFWRENCFPNHLSLAEVLHASGQPITQHPGASHKYFSLLSEIAKGTKILLGNRCQWCSPISNNLWQSHMCAEALFEEAPVSLTRPLICLFSNTEKFCFLFKRSVWETNLVDPKVCYFTLWASALLLTVVIRIWPWYDLKRKY